MSTPTIPTTTRVTARLDLTSVLGRPNLTYAIQHGTGTAQGTLPPGTHVGDLVLHTVLPRRRDRADAAVFFERREIRREPNGSVVEVLDVEILVPRD